MIDSPLRIHPDFRLKAIDPRKIRENIVTCSYVSKHGHLPTCFSIVESIVGVYNVMNHDPSNPGKDDRDIFILSKGHAALGYYCILAEYGYFDIADVEQFGAVNSRFGCHPDRKKVPGVEASCGSLGHGIGIAVGTALALKIKQTQRQVYVLVGDGESNEGSVWESVMIAADRGLDNLTIVYDNNHSQKRCLQIKDPAKLFGAFGCEVIEVDGHNVSEIETALSARAKSTKLYYSKHYKGFWQSYFGKRSVCLASSFSNRTRV